ncbi:WD40/YVTN/BNR-like repeat-containing protein [Lentzea sp. CA-135723]|uniref:WD40/YVTN/BNR-like repeat-containing protein n=1 Tax=Lentzea sp. CA-135723 TaxID=3239950 RepID=UPI003D933877
MRVRKWPAVVLAIAAVVSAAGPAAAQPAWRLAQIPPTAVTSFLQDVAALDAGNAWAVGTEAFDPAQESTTGVPLMLRWNGKTWSRTSLPVTQERVVFQRVAASSAKDVWVKGSPLYPNGSAVLLWRYDGVTWTEVPYPPGATPSNLSIRDLSVVDGHAWLVGHRGNAPVFHEWNGSTWLEHQPPTECVAGGSFPNFCFANTVKAFAPDDVWAAGNGWWNGFMGPVLFHWNGTAWRTVDIGLNQQQLTIQSLDGLSSKDIWAVGDSGGMGSGNVVVRGDGTTWQTVDGLQTPSTPAVAVGSNGVPWVVARIPLPTFRSHGPAGWAMAMAPVPAGASGVEYAAITGVPGTNRMIAVGYAGVQGTNPLRSQAVIAEYARR